MTIFAAFLAQCTSEVVVAIFGWNPRHFFDMPLKLQITTAIYKDFSWYFVFFFTLSFLLDLFNSKFNPKKCVALLGFPFFMIILIKSFCIWDKMSFLSLICYTGGFICGYVPQFFIDQKAIANNIMGRLQKN